MMARRKIQKDIEKPALPGEDFETLMTKIPVEQFDRMIAKSGLPTKEARELCREFRKIKS